VDNKQSGQRVFISDNNANGGSKNKILIRLCRRYPLLIHENMSIFIPQLPELSFILGINNLSKHSSNVHFLSSMPQIGAKAFVMRSRQFTPKGQESLPVSGEFLCARYNFYLVKLNIPVQTPL
jgi:hypothetical protein